MTRIQIAVIAVAALALSGGGFAAGVTVGPSLAKAETSSSPRPAAGQAGRGGAFASGAPGAGAAVQQVSGRVLSVNDGSITVEIQQPGSDQSRSVIALVGSSTRVVRVIEAPASLSDIKPGEQVLVSGQPDQATGTVSANAVVLGVSSLQQIFGGGSGGQGGPGPSGSPGTFRRVGPSPSPSP